MYLRKLREAQNFLSEKYVSKIPMFKQTKFFHSFWSSWQSAKSLDTFEGLKIGTVPRICFLRYRKYDFSILWLYPHSKIAPDMRIHKVSPCSLLLELFFFFFLLKSLLHYEWMPFGQNSATGFCQELLPPSWLLSQEQCLMTLLCMPSLSVWAFALIVISTTLMAMTAIIS